jgi:hypothetical protein
MNVKISKVNQQESDLGIREKSIKDSLLLLGDIENEEFKRLEYEYIGKISQEELLNKYKDEIALKELDLEPFFKELKETIDVTLGIQNNDQTKYRNRLGKLTETLEPIKTDRSISQNTDCNIEITQNFKAVDLSNIDKKTNESKYYSTNKNSLITKNINISDIANNSLLDNIVNNHEMALLNNNEELIENISFNNNSSLGFAMGKESKNKSQSDKLLKTIRTNRTFWLLRAKRMEQNINSSMEISISDIGGHSCCGRLKTNYDVNISVTHQKNQHCNNGQGVECYHNRSSSLQSEVMKRREKRLKFLNSMFGDVPGNFCAEKTSRNIFNLKKDLSKSKYSHIAPRYLQDISKSRNNSTDSNKRSANVT